MKEIKNISRPIIYCRIRRALFFNKIALARILWSYKQIAALRNHISVRYVIISGVIGSLLYNIDMLIT